MSINVISSRNLAWIKFLEQWLVPGTGGGYAEYSKLAKQDIYKLIDEWYKFVDDQLLKEYISEDQHGTWSDRSGSGLPTKIRMLLYTRNNTLQGWPTGVLCGNPAWSATKKLTEADVWEIRRLCYEEEYSIRQIAKAFNVSHGTIMDIKKNRRWRRVKYSIYAECNPYI